MKLKKLEITNFRCFESLSIDLDEKLTVLVAKNGQGKSSVLDSIRIGLWPFVSGFDLARNPGNEAGNNISIDDVRMVRIKHNSVFRHEQTIQYEEMVRQFPSQIALLGHFVINILLPFTDRLIEGRASPSPGNAREIGLVWTRFRESEAKGAKTKTIFGAKTKTRLDTSALHVHHIAIALQDHIRNPESFDTNLPIIGYYGTGRLWSQKRLSEKKKKKEHDDSFYMRLFGYRDCLDPSSSYEHFADWFTWVSECYWEEKINQSKKGLSSETDSVWSNIIHVMQQVTNTLLHETGWHTLEYSVSHEKSLVLKHEEHGTLKVEQLSDGIRNVLGMVGDIAYRCLKLNPHLGLNAAKESSGVVMIDEIDMHLHPEWQQTILGNLCKAFPKIQFIVTTHSPQVLTTVQAKCIRLLSANGDVVTPAINTYGEESKVALEDVMQVSSRPHTDEADLLQCYLQHINQGDIDSPEVVKWRKILEQAFGSEYSKLKLADMVVSKWKAKRGMV
jgi:predicted ATP-binding protein involved in virulence